MDLVTNKFYDVIDSVTGVAHMSRPLISRFSFQIFSLERNSLMRCALIAKITIMIAPEIRITIYMSPLFCSKKPDNLILVINIYSSKP